ncbi:hypothetical protein VN97_g387 [Penicillium thymicola]|uniref:DyP dimeric alpha+beta barrel domain-containing protein n=1 Tax=Penicillium thymicola TaxID=293382 RepID=A0AAI9TT25_PENTH|nr:hypothetical protein VN97_g387 [Penicillium thymicola]
MSHPVDKTNIQGGIWPRMPKEFESYLFYRITNANRFRYDLREFIDEITTGQQCEEKLEKIKSARENGRAAKIPMSGINVSFTHKGLQKVCLAISVHHCDHNFFFFFFFFFFLENKRKKERKETRKGY